MDDYSIKYDYLICCHNILVSLLKYADEKNVSSLKLDFLSGEELSEFEKIENQDEMTKWLVIRGYKNKIYDLYFKHTFLSLVADFCHYMLESIECAGKKKAAVAFALLRKPLKDNLYYIEWLAVDSVSLVDKLLYGQPEDVLINKNFAKEHIDQVNKLYGLDRNNGMFSFRFEKNDPMSLEKIWNKANHIVTTQSYTKSNPGELNFIFADESVIDKYIRYYYSAVPLVVSYAVDIMVAIFEKILNVNPMTNVLNRTAKLMSEAHALKEDSILEVAKLLDLEHLPLICPQCGESLNSKPDFVSSIVQRKISCSECNWVIDLFAYNFDYESWNEHMTTP